MSGDCKHGALSCSGGRRAHLEPAQAAWEPVGPGDRREPVLCRFGVRQRFIVGEGDLGPLRGRSDNLGCSIPERFWHYGRRRKVSVEGINRRVVILALLVTLAIRLAAWGAPAWGTAQASNLNQTIPTATPTGATSTPTASQPTEPPPTQEPTEPPSIATDTPTATSPAPSATATGKPTSSSATATSEATAPDTPTTLPAVATHTPLPTATVLATPTVLESPGQTATADMRPESSPSTAPSATAPSQPSATTQLPETSADAISGGISWFWIVLGLVLILVGTVLLLRFRSVKPEP